MMRFFFSFFLGFLSISMSLCAQTRRVIDQKTFVPHFIDVNPIINDIKEKNTWPDEISYYTLAHLDSTLIPLIEKEWSEESGAYENWQPLDAIGGSKEAVFRIKNIKALFTTSEGLEIIKEKLTQFLPEYEALQSDIYVKGADTAVFTIKGGTWETSYLAVRLGNTVKAYRMLAVYTH